MKDTVINEKNVKIPLYVAAYETISQWLKDGKYKAGDKLPGENILAEQLQVSRGTLRQAMLLLQEDGLIINHQGKGNIVLSNQDMSKSGLERIGNPIVDFCSEPVDRVVTTIGFQPATQKHQQVLKLRPSSVVAVIDITYYSGDTPTGFAMVYMPHEVLDNSNVDLEDTDTVYRYYTELLETSGLYSDTKSAWDRPGSVWPIYYASRKGTRFFCWRRCSTRNMTRRCFPRSCFSGRTSMNSVSAGRMTGI